MDLTVNLGPLHLQNPVITASGTFGWGEEYASFFDPGSLGAVTVKGLTLKPKSGNPPPRLAETPAGLLNSVGLANPGVDKFVNEILPSFKKHYNVPVIANIAGDTVEEYVEIAEMLNGEKVAALELNLSCPNVAAGGMALGIDPFLTEKVTAKVRQKTSLPLIVKLTPNVTDITVIAKAAANGGADILSLINTLVGMDIDLEKQKPVFARKTAGLSGPAIRPIALAAVFKVYEAVNLPLIGMGGIMDERDALKFILAGATAIAVGSANFYDPYSCLKIIEGLNRYGRKEGISRISSLIGRAHQ